MFFGPFSVVLVIIVIGLIVWAVQSGTSGSQSSAQRRAGPQARETLSQRLASGEIDATEYRERLALLDQEEPADSGTNWWPITIFAGVVILLVATMAFTGWGSWGWMGDGWGTMRGHMGFGSSAQTGANTQAVTGAEEITVEAGDLWFDPETVTVTAGEPVNLTLVNTGDAFHDLTIPDLDVVIDAQPGEQATAGIEVDEPGTYEFLCSVPGHADGGMRGELIVQA